MLKKRQILIFLLISILALVLAEPVFAERYEYDALHRLVRVEYDDGSSVSYTYDSNGNITSVTTEGVTTPECRHAFTCKVDDAYLASPATAEAPATYYYSCALCGEKDEAHTFSYGKPLEPPAAPEVVSRAWSWKTDEEPGATLTLLWSDGTVRMLNAEVAVLDSTQTEITYSAIAVFDGVEYSNQTTVQKTYRVTLVNGAFVSGTEKESYSYGDEISVRAQEIPGLAFAGWYIGDTLISTSELYNRCVTEDFTLEARFAEKKIAPTPTASVSDIERTYEAAPGKYKTELSLDWSVPAGCKLVQAGMYRAYSQSPMTASEIAEVGTQSISTLKNSNGSFTVKLTMSSSKKDFDLYYVGYVTYRDAKGQEKTVFTAVGCNKKI